MSESAKNQDITVSGDVEGSQVVAGDRNQIGNATAQINQEAAGDLNQVICCRGSILLRQGPIT